MVSFLLATLTYQWLTGESYCILIVTSGVLYMYLRRENKKREALNNLNEEKRDELAFQDLTDNANPYFRYVL